MVVRIWIDDSVSGCRTSIQHGHKISTIDGRFGKPPTVQSDHLTTPYMYGT